MRWLLLLAAAPAFAQCNYSAAITVPTNPTTPTSLSLPAAGLTGGGQITVTVGSGCPWTFTTDSPSWISLGFSGSKDSNGNPTGQGIVVFAAAANTTPVGRQAIIRITTPFPNPIDITIQEAATTCTWALSPSSITVTSAAGNGNFQVQTACTWSVGTTASWITVANSTAFTGAGNASYSYSQNPCVDTRTGAVVVGYPGVPVDPSQVFTITQPGAPGNLTTSPASLSPTTTGGIGVLSIFTGAGCGWTVFSDVNFVHFTSSTSGTGTAGVGYAIDPNPGTARSGNIHIGSLLIPVAQAGATSAGPVINSVTNSASGAVATSVSPGEFLSLFGTAMGPTPGVAATPSAGAFPTNVSNVQVQFDGVAAPLLYVGAGQINTIAPYRLTPGSSTKITVLYNGATSAVTLPVTAVTPAIFSQDGSGTGIGAILNQDYTVNARLKPASRGDVIAIYMAGTGATSPAGTDGAIVAVTPPFPAVAQTPVTVTIGGVTVQGAQILYAGAAPGSVAGLTQIDVAIPQSVTPSLTTPISVSIGGVSTQSGITVAIQ